MLPRLVEFGEVQNADHQWKAIQDTNGYVEQALGVYFSRLGIDPFQSENKEGTE